MGFISGILRRIIKLILYFTITVVFIIFIPNLPPYTKFSRIEIESTQPRVGALARNDVLNNAEPLYKDKLLGPEAFQIFNGEVYTGLATGEIVKLSPGGHVTFVTQIGQPCTGLVQEHICGRPLGFVIDEKNKYIYVADAYHGIWKVNLITDKKQLLVSPRVPINGRVPKIFNSVVLDKNGDLYWTDSSSDSHLRDGVFAMLADPSGRLFQYDAAKNNSKVLLDDLWFANGLAISPDSIFIVVAETSRYRLTKYYINGPKKGSSEVFVAGLPGLPDNVRPLPDGSGILVSLYNVFDEEHPLLLKSMASTPLVRKFVARLLRLIEIPFEFVQSQFPNYIFENIVHQIGSFGSFSSLTPGMAGLVQINWNGNIVASYYNTDGSLRHISDAIVYNNKLYTGCPHLQNFIGSVPAPSQLKDAFTVKKGSIKEAKAGSTSPPKHDMGEKKESSKTAVPVTEPVKQTTPQPPSTKQPSTVPKNMPKENVKQNTVPKDVKPKVMSKQEGYPNDVVEPKLNQNDEKLKVQVKDASTKLKTATQTEKKPKDLPQVETNPEVSQQVNTKPNVVSKDKIEPKAEPKAEIKSKVASKVETKPSAETKSKLVSKDKKEPKAEPKAEIKSKVASKVETKPSAETKSKLVSKDKKEPEVKPKDDIKLKVETKPTAETKSKVVPKDKKESKDTPQDKTKPIVASQVEKPTVKPIVETKPEIKSKAEATKPMDNNEDKTLKVESQKTVTKETDNKGKVTRDGDIKEKTDDKGSEYLKADIKKPTETESEKVNKPKQIVTETKTRKDTETGKKRSESVSTPKPIPVKENIPSDTAEPKKETLKVIKKSGPQEIRNPNL